MREFINRRVKEIKSDRIQAGTLAIALILTICHTVIYIEDRAIDNLVSIIFCAAYIPITAAAGRKTMPAFFYTFSIAKLITGGSYKNYSAAWFATLALILLPKKTRPFLIALHIIATIVICELHDKTTIHLAVYIINAFFLYIATNLLFQDRTAAGSAGNRLELTDDEKFILSELKTGKQQKEIKLFSINTITKKLRDARTRNGCATTEELLVRYIAQKPENIKNI